MARARKEANAQCAHAFIPPARAGVASDHHLGQTLHLAPPRPLEITRSATLAKGSYELIMFLRLPVVLLARRGIELGQEETAAVQYPCFSW